MSAPRYRFGPHDRITWDGIARRWTSSTERGHVFERIDQPGVFEELSDVQCAIAAARTDYRYDRNYHSAGEARARMRSGLSDLHEVPAKKVIDALWREEWVSRFLKLEQARQASRSDAALKAAVAGMIDDVLRSEAGKALRDAMVGGVKPSEDAPKARPGSKGRQPGGGKLRAGADIVVKARKPPSGKTLLRWIKRYEAYELCATALLDGRHRSGNPGTRLDEEVEAIVAKHVAAYRSETRPPMAHCLAGLRCEMADVNAARSAKGESPLRMPSRATFEARVRALPAFETHAARHGIEAAKRKFAMVGLGLDVTRAGERFEMDDWQVQMHTVVAELSAVRKLSQAERKALLRLRVWMCVVQDAASRCVKGFSIADAPNAASAIAALHMAVRAKGPEAERGGAASPWHMACTPETVATDAGSNFVSDAFKAAVVSIKSSPHTMPAGQPQLRGRIERFFSTVNKQALAGMTGRTFENVVAKGDYKSEASASLVVEMLAPLMVTYIVGYHNRPHGGLGGETPANAWHRLVAAHGISPPPGKDVRRHVFGIPLSRVTGPHGIRLLNLDYQSEALQAYRRKVGDGSVNVKLDPTDLGRVSVQIGKEWLTCACKQRGFADVPVEQWLAAAADLNRRHAAEAKLSEPIVLDALKSIAGIGKEGIEHFGLGSTRPSAASIDRAERDLAMGFSMPREEVAGQRDGDGPIPADGGILSGAIVGTGPLSPDWLRTRTPPGPPTAEGNGSAYRIEGTATEGKDDIGVGAASEHSADHGVASDDNNDFDEDDHDSWRIDHE